MRRYRILMRVVAVAALASAIGACSSDLSLSNVTLVPKPETLMRKPDWATFSGGKNDFELRPITAADLVGPEGQCGGGGPGHAAGFADPTTGGGGPPPPPAAGVAPATSPGAAGKPPRPRVKMHSRPPPPGHH